jgi:hypothetical protein
MYVCVCVYVYVYMCILYKILYIPSRGSCSGGLKASSASNISFSDAYVHVYIRAFSLYASI